MIAISTPLQDRYSGIINGMPSIVDDFGVWNVSSTPIFDIIDTIKPNIVFFDLKYVTTAFIEATQEYKDIKFVLFGHGVPQNIRINAVIAKPSLSPVMKKNIESDNYKTLYVSDNADVASMFGGKYDEKLSCDFLYHYTNADPEIFPKQFNLIAELSKHGKIKVVGPHKLSLPYYLGNPSNELLSTLYKSAKICIDYDGSHILDVAANASFCMSTMVTSLYPPMKDINSILEHLHNDKRDKISKKAQKLVLNSDTCYHKIYDIMLAIEEPNLAEKAMTVLEEKITCNLE